MKKKNIASKLYNVSKTIGKIASITRDIEVLTSGDSKKIAKRAGITKKISAHSLRRTAATNMYRAGFQVKEIQNVLGHQSLGTTDIYLKGLEDCANNVFQNFVIKGE